MTDHEPEAGILEEALFEETHVDDIVDNCLYVGMGIDRAIEALEKEGEIDRAAVIAQLKEADTTFTNEIYKVLRAEREKKDDIPAAKPVSDELKARYQKVRTGERELLIADDAAETVDKVVEMIDKEMERLFQDPDMRAVRKQRLDGKEWHQIAIPLGISKKRIRDALARESALNDLKRRLEDAFVASTDDWLAVGEEYLTPRRRMVS